MRGNPPPLRAGELGEVRQPTGDWTFVDMGFSHASRSCGWLCVRDGDWTARGEALTFGEATARVVAQAARVGPPLHLVLEAPLSAFFDAAGNPVGREGERRGSETRYWYAGLGCVVKVSALFLLEAVARADRAREVRVFEGFVSFKEKGPLSSHAADVEALRDAVLGGAATAPCRVDGGLDGRAVSLLGFLGMDGAALPPIIGARST